MSWANLLWAVITLFLSQDVACFIPQRRVNLPGPIPEAVALPLPEGSSEEGGRAVYDPGDELLKVLKAEDSADYDDFLSDLAVNDNKVDLIRKLETDIKDEQEIVSKSAMLMRLLEDPNVDTLPVVYVEETPVEVNSPFSVGGVEKRSRYYRRYPWKRHSSRNRGTYEPDARYLCIPSKEDVFKLLIGLHENRKGNQQKTVNFCNRKRPAKAIFTNIRFLG